MVSGQYRALEQHLKREDPGREYLDLEEEIGTGYHRKRAIILSKYPGYETVVKKFQAFLQGPFTRQAWSGYQSMRPIKNHPKEYVDERKVGIYLWLGKQ